MDVDRRKKNKARRKRWCFSAHWHWQDEPRAHYVPNRSQQRESELAPPEPDLSENHRWWLSRNPRGSLLLLLSGHHVHVSAKALNHLVHSFLSYICSDFAVVLLSCYLLCYLLSFRSFCSRLSRQTLHQHSKRNYEHAHTQGIHCLDYR